MADGLTFVPQGLPSECYGVVLHLWDYFDERLPPARMAEVRKHIARCNNCQAFRRFQESFFAAMARARQAPAAPPQVRRRVLEALGAAGFAGDLPKG